MCGDELVKEYVLDVMGLVCYVLMFFGGIVLCKVSVYLCDLFIQVEVMMIFVVFVVIVVYSM